MTPFADPGVAAKFEAYPPAVRRKLLALRELVFPASLTYHLRKKRVKGADR